MTILTSDQLDLAADEIQRRGWTKGTSGWRIGDGPVCIEGAIVAVVGENTEFPLSSVERCPAYAAVREFIGMTEGERLWMYNDHIASSAEEVVAVLRAAAAVERAKEAVAMTTESAAA